MVRQPSLLSARLLAIPSTAIKEAQQKGRGRRLVWHMQTGLVFRAAGFEGRSVGLGLPGLVFEFRLTWLTHV